MPIFNLPKNCAYYWGVAGLFIAYFIYGPRSTTAGHINPLITWLGVMLFIIGEVCNGITHVTLRDLRSTGGKERGIPRGLGFSWVTCPNYMFEVIAWIGLLMVTMSWTTGVFISIGIVQMAIWAKKKERTYRKEFGDKYKKKKYVVYPGIY
jgi:very-long-chain enoyl-CoA reductase